MGRKKLVEDIPARIGRPRSPEVYGPPKPEPHQRKEYAARLQSILHAIEAPSVDAATQSMFCRWLWRRQKFPEMFRDESYEAEEQIVLVCRAILESNGNGGKALIEPIVSAVSSCMRPQWTAKGIAWIEAFDQIQLVETWQTLVDLFGAESASEHLAGVLRRKLWAIFGPDVVVAKPIKVKAAPKPPRRVARVAPIEKRIALGLQLLELKAKTRGSSKVFSSERRKQFPDIEPMLAIEATRVARVYGWRPDIYRRVSWQALVELSSPSLSAATRLRLETAIVSGEDVNGCQVKLARGRLPSGRPRQERAAAKMAA